jgi:hypothetical protein
MGKRRKRGRTRRNSSWGRREGPEKEDEKYEERKR